MRDVLLQDMNLPGISARDNRQLEVVANGLPLWGGAQLGVDATLVSPVRRDGQPQPHADDEDGAQLRVARQRKNRKYWELLSSGCCRLGREVEPRGPHLRAHACKGLGQDVPPPFATLHAGGFPKLVDGLAGSRGPARLPSHVAGAVSR